MQPWRIKYGLNKLIACLTFSLQRKIKHKQYKRVYHVHIRKTAGTSVNSAVWNLGGLDLKTMGRSTISIAKGYVFVRHHRNLINAGCYHFANSHASYWDLDLPKNTYKFCVFRDPLQRLLSLYRYYYWVENNAEEAKANDPNYKTLKYYTHWLGSSFGDFLEKLPKQHLLNQLYMFSQNFDVKEATKNVGELSKYYFQDDLSALERDLSDLFQKEVVLKHERAFGKNMEISISEADLEKARKLLEPEYQLYRKIVNQKKPVVTELHKF